MDVVRPKAVLGRVKGECFADIEGAKVGDEGVKGHEVIFVGELDDPLLVLHIQSLTTK